jgi:hypothetical protein
MCLRVRMGVPLGNPELAPIAAFVDGHQIQRHESRCRRQVQFDSTGFEPSNTTSAIGDVRRPILCNPRVTVRPGRSRSTISR